MATEERLLELFDFLDAVRNLTVGDVSFESSCFKLYRGDEQTCAIFRCARPRRRHPVRPAHARSALHRGSPHEFWVTKDKLLRDKNIKRTMSAARSSYCGMTIDLSEVLGGITWTPNRAVIVKVRARAWRPRAGRQLTALCQATNFRLNWLMEDVPGAVEWERALLRLIEATKAKLAGTVLLHYNVQEAYVEEIVDEYYASIPLLVIAFTLMFGYAIATLASRDRVRSRVRAAFLPWRPTRRAD